MENLDAKLWDLAFHYPLAALLGYILYRFTKDLAARFTESMRQERKQHRASHKKVMLRLDQIHDKTGCKADCPQVWQPEAGRAETGRTQEPKRA